RPRRSGSSRRDGARGRRSIPAIIDTRLTHILGRTLADDPQRLRTAIEGRMIGFVSCNRANRFWMSFQAFALAAVGGSAQAQPAGGQISTPESSIEKPGDTGVRAH